MLQNWLAYYDSKTGTKSFYEVDYRSLSLKCILAQNYSLSSLQSLSISPDCFLDELKMVFEEILKGIKEGLTQQQPWLTISKVFKVINNIITYTEIEGSYVKRVSEDNKDLQSSPSLCFVIQRLVRLVKDIHLLCVYTKKKESEDFKQTRQTLKKVINCMKKSCLAYIKTYSKKQELDKNPDPIDEMLMAQFLQLVKFLVNFTKCSDHQEYVRICSGGTTLPNKDMPDIWSITDSSVKQAAHGVCSIMLDSKRCIDTLPSLMTVQNKNINSISTVHDLCSLGEILVRKRDFQTKKSLPQEQTTTSQEGFECEDSAKPYSAENTPMFGKPKGIRRKTEGQRPDERLLKESKGKTRACAGQGQKRSCSLLVTLSINEESETYDVKETRKEEVEEFCTIIEEPNDESSPKKSRNRANISLVDGNQKKEENIVKNTSEVLVIIDKKEVSSLTSLKDKEHGIIKNTDSKDKIVDKIQKAEIEMPNNSKSEEKHEGKNHELHDEKIDGVNEKRENLLKFAMEEEKEHRKTSQEENSKIEELKSSKLNLLDRGTAKTAFAEVFKNNKTEETQNILKIKDKQEAILKTPISQEKGSKEKETAKKEKSSPLCTRQRSISLGSKNLKFNREEKKADVTSQEDKIKKEDYTYHPLHRPERRKLFLDRLFGHNMMEKAQRRFEDSHGLFKGICSHNTEDENNSHAKDLEKQSELGRTRLACIPYMATECCSFFVKQKAARGCDTMKNNQEKTNRALELWEKVRRAVNMKRLLWRVGYDKTSAFPSYRDSDHKILSCLQKGFGRDLMSFNSENPEMHNVEYIGPARKRREIASVRQTNPGHFVRPAESYQDTNDLEVNLMLARLSYCKKSKWACTFSFRSKGCMSIDSRNRDASGSREASLSRDESKDNSGSGVSSTKRGVMLRGLFQSNTSTDTLGLILSPSNKSGSERDQNCSVIGSTSKPSLFRNLLKLHPANSGNNSAVASPKSGRSRASSRASVRENIKSNSSSPGLNNGSGIIGQKRPSLFKTLFKLNMSGKDERSKCDKDSLSPSPDQSTFRERFFENI